LVICLGRVPLAKTVHMDKLCIPTAFAWSNERVLLCTDLFVNAHVADRAIVFLPSGLTPPT